MTYRRAHDLRRRHAAARLLLLGAALVAVLVLPRMFRRSCDPGWRSAAVLTLSYAVVAVGYLSLFTEMQLGIRYIVPIYPVLFL